MINPQPNFQNISDPLGYYTILGISSEADAALVKQSYRDLAKIWHPDHNTDAEALENFQKLSVAYEVLKDDNRRLCYDLFALIYTGDAFPDMENLQAYKAAGAETADIRALSLRNVRGRLWTYEIKSRNISVPNRRPGNRNLRLPCSIGCLAGGALRPCLKMPGHCWLIFETSIRLKIISGFWFIMR